MNTHTLAQIDRDIARYCQLLLYPECWETEDLLLLISHVKVVHAELDKVPQDKLEEYERLVNELDKELRAIARMYPDTFQVYSKDWTKRVNILEDELGWDLEDSS
jgi:hypothetical protein